MNYTTSFVYKKIKYKTHSITLIVLPAVHVMLCLLAHLYAHLLIYCSPCSHGGHTRSHESSLFTLGFVLICF